MAMGFSGFGISGDFIHLDDRGQVGVAWTYQ
jgi:hypothetical protein